MRCGRAFIILVLISHEWATHKWIGKASAVSILSITRCSGFGQVQAYKARLGRRQCSTTACSQSPVSAVYAIIWSIKPPKTMETGHGQLMGMGPLTVDASAASLILRAKTQVIWWVSLATNIVLDPGTAFCEKYFFLVEDKSTHWVWSTWRCKASWIHDVC